MNAYSRWFAIGLDIWTLGVESCAVVALRTAKIAMGGDAAGRETRMMVSEKLAAASELCTALSFREMGASPAQAARKGVDCYSKRVRANLARLS